MKAQETDMHPELYKRWIVHRSLMAKAGLKFSLSAVLRTPAMQLAYAAQGRSPKQLVDLLLKFNWALVAKRIQGVAHKAPLDLCNELRAAAGMAPIDMRDWYAVTSTMNSRHFADGTGKSRAYDIVILKGNEQPTWDVKFDGDGDKIADYAEAATIGQEAGLTAGGFWHQFRDWPHFELPAGVH